MISLRILCTIFVFNFIVADEGVKINQPNEFSSRISEGSLANSSQFPWHALLTIQYRNDNTNRQSYCNGVILNEMWLLSTAECMHNARTVRANVGSVHIETNAVTLFPDTYYVHPQYNPNRFINNLALLRMPLDRPIQLPATPNPAFYPIRLPSRRQLNETFSYAIALYSGFGLNTQNAPNMSRYLMYSQSSIISNEDCLARYGNDPELISPRVICALSFSAGQGACHGDSGAPLVIAESNEWTLVGLFSFLHLTGSCGREHVPVAFSRITHHFDWIAQVTGYQFRP